MLAAHIAALSAAGWNAQSGANVLMRQYDAARTGRQQQEYVLNLRNVNSSLFGKLWELQTDGRTDAQPLYVGSVPIAGVRHNVLYVATELATLFALDADSGTQLWRAPLINSPERPVQTGDLRCSDILPYSGLTATPVINWRSGTLYAETYSIDLAGNFYHRLHAIDYTTGAEKKGSPVLIQTPGFTPGLQKSRPGLAFANGNIYLAFSSHCDQGAYHGWVFAYNATTLAQVAAPSDSPAGVQGGIWAAGAGLAADSDGSIFLATGNGTWDGVANFGQSILRLSPMLNVLDYFTPYNYSSLNVHDNDLGSGGVILLPREAGSVLHPNLALAGGKGRTIYLVDRGGLGHWQSGSDSQIVQAIEGQMSGRIFGSAAYFNGSIYISSKGDALKAFSISNATLSATPTSQTPIVIDYQGSSASISSSGARNGIVWVQMNNGKGQTVLQAYDASNLGTLLYSADQIPSRDMLTLGTAPKFQVPTVANGKVYAVADGSIAAYGLLTPQCAQDITATVGVTSTAILNNSQTITITNTTQQTLSGPFFLVFDGLSSNATVINSNMTSSCAPGPGSFANHFPSDTLAPGASQSMSISFFNPSGAPVTYQPRVVSGNGRTLPI